MGNLLTKVNCYINDIPYKIDISSIKTRIRVVNDGTIVRYYAEKCVEEKWQDIYFMDNYYSREKAESIIDAYRKRKVKEFGDKHGKNSINIKYP